MKAPLVTLHVAEHRLRVSKTMMHVFATINIVLTLVMLGIIVWTIYAHLPLGDVLVNLAILAVLSALLLGSYCCLHGFALLVDKYQALVDGMVKVSPFFYDQTK